MSLTVPCHVSSPVPYQCMIMSDAEYDIVLRTAACGLMGCELVSPDKSRITPILA